LTDDEKEALPIAINFVCANTRSIGIRRFATDE
jgi:hypothetical protein